MSASTFIWVLCSVFAFILVAVTRGFEGPLDVAVMVVAAFVFGFLLLLTLIGLTWKFDYPLWQRLFGLSAEEQRRLVICDECHRAPRRKENRDADWHDEVGEDGRSYIFCPECWRREYAPR